MLAAVTMTVALMGCSQTLQPEQADQGERVEVDAFWHDHLPEQAMVTTAEAYRAVLLLADGEERFHGYASREQELKSRGYVRDAWGLHRDAAIDRGSVAFMVCKAIELRGGVNMRTLGELGVGDRRYAVRELAYRDMMPPGASYRYMTGGELLDLLLEADRYMARHDMYEHGQVDIAEIVGTGSPGSDE